MLLLLHSSLPPHSIEDNDDLDCTERIPRRISNSWWCDGWNSPPRPRSPSGFRVREREISHTHALVLVPRSVTRRNINTPLSSALLIHSTSARPNQQSSSSMTHPTIPPRILVLVLAGPPPAPHYLLMILILHSILSIPASCLSSIESSALESWISMSWKSIKAPTAGEILAHEWGGDETHEACEMCEAKGYC